MPLPEPYLDHFLPENLPPAKKDVLALETMQHVWAEVALARLGGDSTRIGYAVTHMTHPYLAQGESAFIKAYGGLQHFSSFRFSDKAHTDASPLSVHLGIGEQHLLVQAFGHLENTVLSRVLPRTPTEARKEASFDVRTSEQPTVSHLRGTGCLAFTSLVDLLLQVYTAAYTPHFRILQAERQPFVEKLKEVSTRHCLQGEHITLLLYKFVWQNFTFSLLGQKWVMSLLDAHLRQIGNALDHKTHLAFTSHPYQPEPSPPSLDAGPFFKELYAHASPNQREDLFHGLCQAISDISQQDPHLLPKVERRLLEERGR